MSEALVAPDVVGMAAPDATAATATPAEGPAAPLETLRQALLTAVDSVRGLAPALTDAAFSVANMEAVDAAYRAAGLDPRPSLAS